MNFECVAIQKGYGYSSTAVTLKHNNITTLTGIEKFKNIKYLNLTNNYIKDITLLSELQKIEDLYLFGNNIQDITPLKSFKTLNNIGLSYNCIKDITPLIDIPNLETVNWLNLKNNYIKDNEYNRKVVCKLYHKMDFFNPFSQNNVVLKENPIYRAKEFWDNFDVYTEGFNLGFDLNEIKLNWNKISNISILNKIN